MTETEAATAAPPGLAASTKRDARMGDSHGPLMSNLPCDSDVVKTMLLKLCACVLALTFAWVFLVALFSIG